MMAIASMMGQLAIAVMTAAGAGCARVMAGGSSVRGMTGCGGMRGVVRSVRGVVRGFVFCLVGGFGLSGNDSGRQKASPVQEAKDNDCTDRGPDHSEKLLPRLNLHLPHSLLYDGLERSIAQVVTKNMCVAKVNNLPASRPE
jgi:hypothetical protein